ncbi:hypothetical protein VaNZ11_004440 [Volvox africanus]|uniref:Peptidase M1 leukotriene A4 hydrolase/aminopeptidase C-terminal domain-containing protein n=1 Tax=Volvox africanus TaxID=51714 RepID=A0ABQ5RWW4_9CHLO|nr:hypothetical protein VaNZ11_004440 [Volvox africanus]
MRITQVPFALTRRACSSALAQVPFSIRARNAVLLLPDSQITFLASLPRSGALRPQARPAHPTRHQAEPSFFLTRATTTTRSSPVPLLSSMAPDHSSLSNFTEIRVTHSDFELDVNLGKKIIEGYVQLDAIAEVDSPSHLLLDTRDLTIHRVELHSPLQSPQEQGGPIPLKFQMDEPHKVLGSALRLELPANLVGPLTRGSRLSLGVRFTTSPSSSAVQFLDPAQTAGGRQPYLFTQCQAIHARSLVPCQDSPGAKMSYSAVVRVPQPLTALMSAVPDEQPPAGGLPHLADVEPNYPTNLFSFYQKVPIAPYLLALAVGELSSATLGPRTRVWSEPSMVEAGAYEFADTNRFLEAGEAIAGEYVWGRYDLLLLPPSFPYGGMENPCLTFVTPTLLAGDRSLTNVVAHEIAHSWTGNLVTNATWEHFWLNEGFTMFLERKILGRLHGPAAFQFHASQGAAKLAAEVERLGADNPYTRLVPDLSGGVDPDDVFSSIPYEKGFYFLYYLQELVGGADVFDPFLAAYIAAHQHTTLTSAEFRKFFEDYFKEVPAAQTVDWDTWFFSPGMPPVTNTYDTSLAQQAYDLAMKWHTCDVMGIGSDGPAGASPADVAGWSSEQMVAFLDKLRQFRALQPMHKTMTKRLAELYGIYDSNNSEIRYSFFKLAIPAEDDQALSAAASMLRSQGRMKFLRPLYRALHRSKAGRQLAENTFADVGMSYHPIARKMVAADLGIKEQ